MASPWGLTWDDENYYLIAYDTDIDSIKHYRVDKMINIKVLDESREGAETFEGFDMGVYSKKTFGMFGGDDEQVTLRCNKLISNAIVDRFGSDVIMIPVDDDHFEVSTKVSVSPTFLGWVAMFGKNMMIKSPASVVEKFKEHINETIKLYE